MFCGLPGYHPNFIERSSSEQLSALGNDIINDINIGLIYIVIECKKGTCINDNENSHFGS
jgi:hypothetical protein